MKSKDKFFPRQNSFSLRNLKEEWDGSAWILLLAPVLLTLWVYGGKQVHFARIFPHLTAAPGWDFYATLYEYGTAFLLMGLIPMLFVKVVLKKTLRSMGIVSGDWRAGGRILLVGIPIALLTAFLGSGDAAMQAEYPLAKSVLGAWPYFVVIEAAYLVYYFGWEFLFRGFMLFGLEKRFGALPAILIQTILSAIVHIGKPFSESFGAIAGGIIFGVVAWRTRSIFYPLVLHACLGIGTDLFIMLRV